MEKLLSSPTTWSATHPYNQRRHVHRLIPVYAVLPWQIVQQLKQRPIQGDQKISGIILCSTKSTNAAVIGISKSKLDASVLEQEISIDNYKILRYDRNRHGRVVACYIRNDLSYNILSVFPYKIENIFFEILLPNSKPVIVETI